MLIKHKEDCLSINGQQSVNLEEGIIEFKNYFKQLPVPFKIYADFECNLRDVEIYEGSYTKNIMKMFLVVMLVCIDDRFTTSTVVSRGEHAAYEFIKPILEEHIAEK